MSREFERDGDRQRVAPCERRTRTNEALPSSLNRSIGNDIGEKFVRDPRGFAQGALVSAFVGLGGCVLEIGASFPTHVRRHPQRDHGPADVPFSNRRSRSYR
jgi:hypothetical protein